MKKDELIKKEVESGIGQDEDIENIEIEESENKSVAFFEADIEVEQKEEVE